MTFATTALREKRVVLGILRENEVNLSESANNQLYLVKCILLFPLLRASNKQE